MHLLVPFIVFIFYYASVITSLPVASPLGPGYPPPVDLTSPNSLVAAAWSKFTATIDSYIQADQSLKGLVRDLGSFTISIGVFSIYDDAAQDLQYHHTGPDIKNSKTGVTEVDGDSIYRIESITKAFTVYLTLIEVGSGYWDRPVTDFIPELAASNTVSDPINVVDWEQVTLGTLAGQISGIPRDTASQNNDILSRDEDTLALGLPPLNISSADAIDPCFDYANASGNFCPTNLHLEAVNRRAPVYLPWTAPIYTNLGFNLLALAVENITGESFSAMMKADLLEPLGLTSTYYSEVPDITHAAIPSSVNKTFPQINHPDAASGEIFSTVNDLAKLGTSILKSTLLSPQETRKWLKPITHTSSLYSSVGRPWEILRITHPSTGRVNDLYTKDGDGEGYSSLLILSPDHGAGFSILVAGNEPATYACHIVADTLTTTVINALEAQAAAEASHSFAGTYSSPTLNSSLTLSVNPALGPGLHLTSWISNSSDLFAWLQSQAGDEIALFPTDITTAGYGKAGRISFRGTAGDAKYTRDLGAFTGGGLIDGVWFSVDALEYGGISLDWFIFDVDEQGRAVAVETPATRATLERVG